MTVEERLRSVLGDMMFQNIALMTQLEQANTKIKELEAEVAATKIKPQKEKIM